MQRYADTFGRVVMSVLRVAVMSWLACAVFLTGAQRLFVFPGAFGSLVPVPPLPPAFRELKVTTPDGVILRGLWKPPVPGCGVVVSYQGNGDVPDDPAQRFGTNGWARNGWGVMVIAYRGYPGSTGHLSGDGIAIDAVAAYDEARRLAPGAPILIHGHSMGTYAAVEAAAARPDHVALYLEAPFLSMRSVVGDMFPWLPVSVLLLDPMRSDEAMRRVRGEVVIVHGERDGVVPISSGRALADLAPSGTTTFDAVDADHVSLLGLRDAVHEPAFRDEVGASCTMPR